MKTSSLRNLLGASAVAFALATSIIPAQAQNAVTTSEATTSSTTSDGTISEFSPGMITIKSETSSTPVHYTYSKTTTYVDENGSPVSVDIVKSGLPVTVYYVKQGDVMVASKVIVRRHVAVVPATPTHVERTETTTTTTAPAQ